MDDLIASLTRLLPGLTVSIQLTLLAVVVGVPLGFLAGMLLNHKRRVIRYPVIALVELFRGFPALLTLYLVYFGLAQAGILLDGVTAVAIAFGVTSGAYTAEIFRAAIVSVPRGQIEAAHSLAMSPSAIVRRIVIPHVLLVVVPPIVGIVIITFQGTALAMSIGVTELVGRAFSYGLNNFVILPELALAGVLYMAVTALLSLIEAAAERRSQRINSTGRRTAGRKPRRPLQPVGSGVGVKV